MKTLKWLLDCFISLYFNLFWIGLPMVVPIAIGLVGWDIVQVVREESVVSYGKCLR